MDIFHEPRVCRGISVSPLSFLLSSFVFASVSVLALVPFGFPGPKKSQQVSWFHLSAVILLKI